MYLITSSQLLLSTVYAKQAHRVALLLWQCYIIGSKVRLCVHKGFIFCPECSAYFLILMKWLLTGTEEG